MKKKRHTSKLLIFLILFQIIAYVVVAIWFQYKTGMELSPTLTVGVFGLYTAEYGFLSSIKKMKIKNNYGSDQTEEESQG